MIRRRKKWYSDFPIDRSAFNNAHILETQIPNGHPVNYPSFDGLYTLKNSKTVSDNLMDSPFLSPQAKVKGFLESSGTVNIDLTSKKKKIVKAISGSVFHFFADDVCDILYSLRVNPGAELILDLCNVQEVINKPSWSFLSFFFDSLQDQGVSYKLIDSSKFDIIYINDYMVAESAYRSSISGSMIFNFFKKYIDEPDTKPYRKVYLTRAKVDKDTSKLKKMASDLSYQTDARIDNEDALAQIFSDLGYEVIAPEDFKDFHEQLNYFYSVKTIASLTSSGLANALFMQPGGTMIEISTPLVVLSPILSGQKTVVDLVLESGANPSIAQEVHMFYKTIAFLKNHTYLSVNNPNRSHKELESEIFSNTKVLDFIKNDN